jgi:hypothetical protein
LEGVCEEIVHLLNHDKHLLKAAELAGVKEVFWGNSNEALSMHLTMKKVHNLSCRGTEKP